GGKALLSWSGTMFEYLMPLLFTKDFPDTLLSVSYQSVVRAQQAYGQRRGVPWGVSESGYSGVDFEKNYQYYAFGIPGLGLKRGLSEDLVVSPYSTCLALLINPQAALTNLRYLEDEKARGGYGFYEALDYTRDRLASDEQSHVLHSYLAHHQGMTLVALTNLLDQNCFQERFHSDPAIQATELLLQERFPQRVPAIVPHQAELYRSELTQEDGWVSRGENIGTPHTNFPVARILSNGRYSVQLDNAGVGYSFLDANTALTRWREDLVSAQSGYFIYVRDLDSNKVWSVAYQPTLAEPESYEVIFSPDKIEYKRKDFGIALHTEITVSPEDNVEIRKVIVRNLSSQPRRLELTTYAEVVLGDLAADIAHPAFAKMFVESSYLKAHDALLFSRRPRSKREDPLFLLHMAAMKVVWKKTEYDTSRFNFIGRGRSVSNPWALDKGRELGSTIGAVLDPCFSLRVRVEVAPGSAEEAAFITAVSNSREELIETAARYHEVHAVNRAFDMAWSQSNIELRHEHMTIGLTHVFQHLANGLIYNVPTMRGRPEDIVQNRLGQSGLWRFGISGDFPLVLLNVSDPLQLNLVMELLAAHWYLRSKGLQFDLLILNRYPGGYLQDFHEELTAAIRNSHSASLQDKPGGVFLRKLEQLSEQDIALLNTVARVVLDGELGSLKKQVSSDLTENREALPQKRKRPHVLSELGEVPSLEMPVRLGGFCDNGRSYMLLLAPGQRPPLPWSNVIANEKFGFLVTESGGGYTWSSNSRENRLTPWSNDPICDPTGEVLYIRDPSSGDFWSTTPSPAGHDLSFEVRHAFGYSSFLTQCNQIKSTLTISGSTSSRVKWWHLHLSNLDRVERELEIVLYVDWVLGVHREESARYIMSEYDKAQEVLFCSNFYNKEFAGRQVYLGSSLPISGITTDRREFIGRNRSLSEPQALLRTEFFSLSNMLSSEGKYVQLSGRTGAGYDTCGVINVRVTIEPGTEQEVLFYMGEADSTEERRARSQHYSSTSTRLAELQATSQEWHDLTDTIQVKTPQRSFDIMVNGWLLYQTLACRLYGRSAFYQSGGAYGFRDQLQDVLALLYSRPDIARKQILLHATRQFIDGDVQHWWHPPTGRGVRTRISDDYLWLPYVVHRYIETTGDRSILDEELAFLDGQRLDNDQNEIYIEPHTSSHTGSLYEHCVIALDRALVFGSHDLPLIGGGDWNDGMNEVGIEGKGESVWLAWFLYEILHDFSGYLVERRDSYRAAKYAREAERLRSAAEKYAWDGNWYLRAFFDDGTPLGSHTSKECQIDSISQSWAVISGAADPQRARAALEQVYDRLVDHENQIVRLLTPPFNESKPHPGYIAGYLPGIRENGAQYTHAACWVIMANAILGNGERAFELFQMINPVNHCRTDNGVARYQGEPYVTCGDVYSVEPYSGRAGWSWYSGSAGWLYTVAIEHILGLKVQGDLFSINPCVPAEWDEFEIKAALHGNNYHIHVRNPQRVESGVYSLRINGKAAASAEIPLKDLGNPAYIEVTMGVSPDGFTPEAP
ncbi:MAG: hypothetical protein KDD42_00720, partial [Bdellovibrionales bacterium]|nr:hypothetical protein [Bdellovibrionales bacterium]